MMDWPYVPIDTHVKDALSRYTYQYRDMEALQGLTRLWAERLESIEDATYSTLTTRWLDDAAGVQLDELGAIVGEPRLARNDDDYRDAIGVRVSINQSGGEPERIIEFLTRIAGADQVIYTEIWPAKIEVYVRGDVTQSNATRTRALVPAAVGTIYVSETGGLVPFGTSGIGIEEGIFEFDDGLLIELHDTSLLEYRTLEPSEFFDDVDGWGELGYHTIELSDGDSLELSDSDILGATSKDDSVPPSDGGHLAELFEVP